MSAPAPGEQIVFLQRLQRLLGEGSFVATYKFALLHALADLAVVHGDDSGAELTLTTRAITEEMIELYWRQALPFPGAAGGDPVLKQNAGSQAKILLDIAEAQERAGASLAQHRRRGAEWDRLVRRVEPTVRGMPLGKLQTVGGGTLPFLYENPGKGSREITLRPGVAFCLRAFYPLVVDLVRGAWLRHVRAQNTPALGEGGELGAFLFGTGRASLAVYRPILAEVQRGACFYCENRLQGPGEVDHFIPWARYPVDLGHNFVLAHAGCNRAKSDHLAAERHLEGWLRRNDDHAASLASAFDHAGILYSAAATTRIGRWAYAQTSRIGGQVWEERDRFRPLTPGWEALFGPAPGGTGSGPALLHPRG